MAEEEKAAIGSDMNITPEEMQELKQFVEGANSPAPDQTFNAHKIIKEVMDSDDTTKTAFLTDEELGPANFPVRALQELALFCNEIADMPEMGAIFKKEAEIVNATSLSRDAKLLGLAVIARRELADVTAQPKKENKGWFKKKGGGS